jgi:starch-binding outer membrane protein, SusD/RagB family
MKLQIRILLVLISFLLLQVSCSEDFLAPKPLSFFAPENVYVNKAGFEAGLVTVRKDLLNDFYGNRSNIQLEYVSSDFGKGIALDDWTIITPSSGTFFPILQLFERWYSYIKNANVIISRIDNIEWPNQADRNAILAQAMFYRTWWYYRLINTYGDVPFVGYEVSGPKLDFYTHSRWTILERLISDMEFCAEHLPATTPKGVVNKYAALHFLSKLYIQNLEFNKAITAATSVINGPYSLMRNRFGVDAANPALSVIWDLHRPQNKTTPANTEQIFSLLMDWSAPVGARMTTHTMRGYHPGWWYAWVSDSQGGPATATHNPNGTYTEQYRLLGRANPDVNQSYWFSYEIWEDDNYNWRTTPDNRRRNWWEQEHIITNNPNSVDFGQPVNPANFSNLVDSLRLWPMPQYKTVIPHHPDDTGVPLGGQSDWYVFRLAETYLLRAEAHFWKGELVQAANDINVIRERANAPLVTAADIDVDFVFDERLRELFFEEMRHTEIVRAANIMARLGINGYSLDNMHQKNWWHDRVMDRNTWYKWGNFGGWTHRMEPRYIFWPIDVNIITTNTMGVINQNKGFDGEEFNVPPLTEIDH